MSNNLVKYSILLLLCLLHVNVSAQISSGGSPLPYKHPQPSEKARKVVATESVTNFYYKLPVDVIAALDAKFTKENRFKMVEQQYTPAV